MPIGPQQRSSSVGWLQSKRSNASSVVESGSSLQAWLQSKRSNAASLVPVDEHPVQKQASRRKDCPRTAKLGSAKQATTSTIPIKGFDREVRNVVKESGITAEDIDNLLNKDIKLGGSAFERGTKCKARASTSPQKKLRVASDCRGCDPVSVALEVPETTFIPEKVASSSGSAPSKKRRTHATSEMISRQALEAGNVGPDVVLRALVAADVPHNSNRKNVMPPGATSVQGMAVGLYIFGGFVGMTDAATQNPWLTRLLIRFFMQEHGDFPFTTIQVNKNYAARPHVDKNNLGQSLIVGLGDYQGGELWIHEDDGNVELSLKEDIALPHYREGALLKGRNMDIRNTWESFDGNQLHFTQPFTGNRYTLIYFTLDRYKETPPDMRVALHEAGFSFGWDREALELAFAKKKERRAEIRKEIQRLQQEQLQLDRERRGQCFARTWNRGWGGRCAMYCPSEDVDFCTSHNVSGKGSWKVHGRIDGPIPEAKKREMMKWQRVMLSKGEQPPAPAEGTEVLVEMG